MFSPIHPQRPKRRDIVFGCMCIINNKHVCVFEKWVGIEQATVCSDRHSIRTLVFSLGAQIVLIDTSCEPYNRQAVFLTGLFDYLVDKLPGRAEIDNTLFVFATAPFSNEQPYKSLTASGRELQCLEAVS